MANMAVVCFSDIWDRLVHVWDKDKKLRIYRVQSAGLRVASPVWRAMLNPDVFREGSSNAPMEFHDDDPDALKILLSIVHFRFDQVPAAPPSFEWLVQIAVLCDKYDVVHVVRPFLQGWLTPFTDFCFHYGYELWIYVAWVFGCPKIFEALAGHIRRNIFSCGGKWEMYYHRWEGSELLDDLLPLAPPGIVENIKRTRKEALEALDTLARSTAEITPGDLRAKGDRSANRCNPVDLPGPEACLDTNVGPSFLLRCLNGITLPMAYFRVYWMVGRKAKAITDEEKREGFKQSARRQLQELSEAPVTGELKEQMPSAVMEQHTNHMERQAVKSGMGHLEPTGTEPAMNDPPEGTGLDLSFTDITMSGRALEINSRIH